MERRGGCAQEIPPEPKGQAMTNIGFYRDWPRLIREITERAMTEGTIDTTKLPYTVTADDSNRCECCGRGRTWEVVGPDGVALGIAYDNQSNADEFADDLSRAYLAGAQAAIKTLQQS
jgi:hypothetical protein